MSNYFSKNLKFLRTQKGLSQNKLAEIIGVNQTTIARWEDDNRVPTIDNAVDVSNALNIPLPELLGKDLMFDNAQAIEVNPNVVKIPVLGVIKAGTPIEAQENIIDYIEIPKEWLKGNKKFYGLLINGDSMFPKYLEKDIVIFEQNDDMQYANGKDCAVLVNGFDATFKRFNLNEDGITLTPLNIENSDGYTTTFYNVEQVQALPVKVIGIAKQIRRNI